jgi:hypothetical protein
MWYVWKYNKIDDAILENLKLGKGSDSVWWSKSELSDFSCRYISPPDGQKFLCFNSKILMMRESRSETF